MNYKGAILQINYSKLIISWSFSYNISFVKLTTKLHDNALCMRGIWKVLSMVLYLSNQFTNPIMFGIILKRYLSSMLLHKFHEDIIMQT